jgi:hypothetical protein
MPRVFGFPMRQHQKQLDACVRPLREAEALETPLLQFALQIFRCHSEVLVRRSEALVERTRPLGTHFHRMHCVVEHPRPLAMQFQLLPGPALILALKNCHYHQQAQ